MTAYARDCRARAPSCAVAALLMALAGTPAALAQDHNDHPTPDASAVRRTIRVFDFEEPANPEAIPVGWLRAQSQRGVVSNNPDTGDLQSTSSRPGFPEYNRAEFDFQTFNSGQASVRLPTQGGSTSLRLRPGELPVFPDADYVVSAWVRTSELKQARAFVAARLLDQRLLPLRGTDVRSEAVLSVGHWTMVSVALPASSRDSAWIQIDLELLQTEQFRQASSGPPAQHEIWRQDVRGDAWFDDVGVYQVPRAKLWTSSPDNIIAHDHTPSLWMMVSDVAGASLRARVSVQDVLGRVVDTQERTIDPGARAASWSPQLPGYGWYKGVLEVHSDAAAVSKAEVTFAYLAPPRARSVAGAGITDRHRFGVLADTQPENALERVPEIVRALGTGFVFLPAFDPGEPSERAADVMRGRSDLYDQLFTQTQQITLSAARIPDELARQLLIDTDDAVGMCERQAKHWYPYFEPTLDVYGQRLVRYQLGPSGDRHTVRRELNKPLSALETALSKLVPNPSIALSWRAEYQPPSVRRERVDDPSLPQVRSSGAMVDAVTLQVPASFSPQSVGELTSRWHNFSVEPDAESPPELTVVPELPSSSRFGGDAPVIELVKRAVEFWAATGNTPNPPRLGIAAPWVVRPDRPISDQFNRDGHAQNANSTVLPSPELPAFRTLIDQLGGRRVVSTLPAPQGVRAYVLASYAGHAGELDDGCVIAWNQSADTQVVNIDIAPAGSVVRMTDVYGNTMQFDAPVPKQPGAAAPLLSMPVGESPVYIEGVDPYLAMFAAGFRVDPDYIPAVVSEHDHTLNLANPWPVRITGKLQLRESEGNELATRRGRADDWTITPRGLIDFAISPGESISIPMTITLGAGQLAGVRDFVVVARVNADRHYPPIRLKTPIEIGLPSIDMTPEVRLSPTPEGPDVIVTAAVTNRDTRSRVLRIEATASNQATQLQQISDLAPGQTTLRRFVFKDAAKPLSGRRVFVTLTEAEGAERLNKAVKVP